MGDVEALTVDLDGTVCEYRRDVERVLAVSFDRVGVEPVFDAEAYRARFDEFAERTDGASELRAACFAALAADAGRDPGLGRAVAAAYEAERDQHNVRFRPGAEEGLAAATERYPVAVVTNGPRGMQTAKLDAVGARESVATVVAAGERTPAKPAPEPFRLALDEVGVRPEAAVHVGDSSADVAGAHAAGLAAALVGDEGDDREEAPEYRFESLAALRDPPWA